MGLRALITPALVTAALVPGAPAGAAAPDADPQIVVYRSTDASVATETAQRERRLGFRARHQYGTALQGFAAELTPGQARALARDPEVAAVVPDRPVRLLASVPLVSGEPTPPPGIRRVGAATATTAREASSVGVAVLDTGVSTHPDLNVKSGKSCITGEPWTSDGNGHGTHVAGTIAAENDGAGVVGVAPGTPIHPVKVLSSSGNGSVSTVVCGLDWVAANAAANNIKVANMSLGGPGERSSCPTVTDAEHKAVCSLVANGVTVVAAAGNEGSDIAAVDWDGWVGPTTPAVFPEVLTVAAITDTDGVAGGNGAACGGADPDDRYASYSNYATRTEDLAHLVSAPGSCVRSTSRTGGHTTMSGTSMATPHVAGMVALCHGENGADGPCATQAPADIIARFAGDAAVEPLGRLPVAGLAGDGTFGPLDRLPFLFPPAVSAGTASLTETGATVSGTVTPGRLSGTWRVEYGIDGFSSRTADTAVPAGDARTVSAQLSGLTAGATYRWRLVADNAAGDPVSADGGTFTLPAPVQALAETTTPTTTTETTTTTATTETAPPPADLVEPTPAPVVEEPVEEAPATAPTLRSRLLTVSVRTLLRRGLRVRWSCEGRCSVRVRAVVGKRTAKRLKLRRRTVLSRTLRAASGTRTVSLRPALKVRRSLRRAGIRRVTVRVTVTVSRTTTRDALKR